MKAFRIDAKLRNNRLVSAREELGYTSCHQAAVALGLNYALLVQLEGLSRSPWVEARAR